MRHYVDASNRDVVQEWVDGLRDTRARAKILLRFDRLEDGNFGDCKPLREGVWELRIEQGAGYRVYYAKAGPDIIVLLNGGDKRKQDPNIERAVSYWQDYQQRY